MFDILPDVAGEVNRMIARGVAAAILFPEKLDASVQVGEKGRALRAT